MRRPKEKVPKRKARGNGTGSKWELPDGRWRWMLTDYGTGKRVTLASGIATDKTAAEKSLAQAITDRDRGLLVAPDRITVAEYTERWLTRQKNLRPSSAGTYRLELGYALKHIGAMRVQEVKTGHLKDVLASLADQEMTAGPGKGQRMCNRTLGKVLTRLRSVFREAVSDGIIYRDPTYGVKRMRSQAAPRERVGRVLDFPEAARLVALGPVLERATLCRPWPALFTALSLGLRRGEVLGLRWQDIDFEANAVRVHQALTIEDGGLAIGPTKTENSERDIPLPASLRAVLLGHRDRLAQERERAGEGWIDSGAAFPAELGGWLHPDNLYRALQTLIRYSDPETFLEWREAGMKRRVPREVRADLEAVVMAGKRLPKVSPHDLRHTYATLALRRGVPVAVVSKILGHKDISTTLDIYRHVLESEVREHAIDLFAA